MDNPAQCKALNVSDEKRCLEAATSVNGLFCSFHSKQCQGLYRGYKLRNARLDRLSANPPPFLKNAATPLSHQDFSTAKTKEECKEIHDHLFLTLQLLERVIRARKLHHSRFFAEDCDYGHEKYLEGLQSQKGTVIRALERLERRTAEVIYGEQKWYSWVRECQDEEEKGREKEREKVKMEAAMFKRHWKAAQLRAKDAKAKEDKMRQDAYLEQVYKERLAEKEKNGERDDTEDDEMDWDPIENVLEDNRGSYLDLIQTFLWMVDTNKVSENKVSMEHASALSTSGTSGLTETSESAQKSNIEAGPAAPSTPASKKAKSKKKKANPASKAPDPTPEPDKGLIESRDVMRQRLKNGTEYNKAKVTGVMIGGTAENPVIATKTITFPEDQIQQLLTEIHEIKYLLFCRLLLGHVALLPAALRANSVDKFLTDPEVTTAALRDICLKMEKPSMQNIRDACADLFRSEEEEEEADIEMAKPDVNPASSDCDEHGMPMFKPKKAKGELPDTWKPKSEMAKMAKEMGQLPTFDSVMQAEEGGVVNFGENRDAKIPRKKIRVKICGKSIWNYPSNKAMNRGGWLHFCIIAKDSSIHDAIALCRHWDEFFELNILAIWQYFPGANWAEWAGNRYRQQMLELERFSNMPGFIMYCESVAPDAEELTIRQNNRNRDIGPRSHTVFEARNFICAHIKRDDPVSRRLVQYLSMQSHTLMVLVRDAETGKLLVKPEEEERWLYREKRGIGRASRNEGWHIIKSIGPSFFEEMDRYRKWRFSFKEYFDVYVWDLQPGEPFAVLYNTVQEMLFKAHCMRSGVDMYAPSGSVLKTLCRNEETNRPRDIKQGEEIESIWDEVNHSGTTFFYSKDDDHRDQSEGNLALRRVYNEPNKFPKKFFYEKADELEDAILFPEELAAKKADPLDVGNPGPIEKWIAGFSLKGFIEGDCFESDDESESSAWMTDSDAKDEDEDLDDDDDEDSHEFPEVGAEDDDGEHDDEHVADPADLDQEMADSTNDAKPEEKSKIGLFDIPRAAGFSDELQEVMRKMTVRERRPSKDRRNPAVMHSEFMDFLDKEKAKVFKQAWHNADLEPNAQAHYMEMVDMTKKCRRYFRKLFDCAPIILGFQLVDDLDVEPEYAKGVHKAIAKVAPFFWPQFLWSKDGEPFRNSLMFNQAERAKDFPDIRSHVSNKYRSPEFFKEFEDAMTRVGGNLADLPPEWDLHMRPIIAQLYKCGVIRSRSRPSVQGEAIAAKEPGRDKYDVFFDWRRNMHLMEYNPAMVNPHSITAFKITAKEFSLKNPKARFAVLSLWSAPHFYPLMIGWDNRDPTSFRDLIGRHFNWMFVPKDLPRSEWSIHLSASGRIAPFKEFLGKNVVAKRDKYLVMAADEKELFKLVAATTFAIQTKPWRLELDLWKSFVNVDIGFLEGLDNKWLE